MLVNYFISLILVVLIISLFSLAIKLNRLFIIKQTEIELELLVKMVGLEVSYVEQEYPQESTSSKFIKIYDNVVRQVNLTGCSFNTQDIEEMIKTTTTVFNRKNNA